MVFALDLRKCAVMVKDWRYLLFCFLSCSASMSSSSADQTVQQVLAGIEAKKVSSVNYSSQKEPPGSLTSLIGPFYSL